MRNNTSQGRQRFLRPAVACAAACAVALSLLVGVVQCAEPYTVEGKCVGITDGDTLVVLDSKNAQHRIRLTGIDAPEKKQPHGMDAKQALSKFAFGKQVVVTVASKDRYGRELGSVVADGFDVNGSMVLHGFAWVYRDYKFPAVYLDYEAEARKKKRGLWATANPIRPQDWRKGQR